VIFLNAKRTVFLISGPPGAGKSTLADKLCTIMDGLCVHIEGDSIYNLVKKGWVHPCDDHDNFFLNVLWENIVDLVENFTNNNMNVVIDYVFSKEQVFLVIDRIKHLDIHIKLIVMKNDINILIDRDSQRNGVAFVGEERIKQIVNDFNLNCFPDEMMLDNNDADLEELVTIVLNEDRFTLN
jgi:adenylate kinase family enzyme